MYMSQDEAEFFNRMIDRRVAEQLAKLAVPQSPREGLAAELMAFHNACSMDSAGGDGQFRILCSSGSSEQALALRAVLREAAAALSVTRPHREAGNG